jgi:hypothetical protein
VVKGSAVSRLPGITGRLAQFRYRVLLLPDGLRSSAIECFCYRTACAVPLSNAFVTGRLAQFRYRMTLLPDGLRSSAIECLCYRTACAVPLSNDSAAKKLTSPLERQYIFEAGKLF